MVEIGYKKIHNNKSTGGELQLLFLGGAKLLFLVAVAELAPAIREFIAATE